MNEKQKENLNKLKTLLGWMNDLDACLYQVQAQYVVALALFNYIETLGMFLIGYSRKEGGSGSEPTSCRDRFESFFSYLGPQYKNLIDNGKSLNCDVYDELRCGLTHELVPKKYNFAICHVGTNSDWYEKNNEEKEEIKKEKIGNLPCGVIFDTQNKIWLIFVHKLLYDFDIAKNKLVNEIEKGDEKLIKNFDKIAKVINLENFKIC